jgi:hypothetical protein
MHRVRDGNQIVARGRREDGVAEAQKRARARARESERKRRRTNFSFVFWVYLAALPSPSPLPPPPGPCVLPLSCEIGQSIHHTRGGDLEMQKNLIAFIKAPGRASDRG